MPPTSKEVSNYINRYDGEVKERLGLLRELIFKMAPTATESMSYGMPAYKVDGKVFIYYAASKNHIGVYPGKIEDYNFNKELQQYASGKSTLQFKHTLPLPAPLISELLRHRLKELSESPVK